MNKKYFKFDSVKEARDWLRANDGYILDEYGNKYFIDDYDNRIGKELWGDNGEGVWEMYDIVYFSDAEFIKYHKDDFSDLSGWLHTKN